MKKKLCTLVLLLASSQVFGDYWTDPETGIQWFYENNMLINKGGKWEDAYKFSTPDDPTLDAAVQHVPSLEILEMPSNLGGRDTLSIGALAFCECTNVTTLIIPSTVTSINPMSFATGSVTNDMWAYSASGVSSYYRVKAYERGGVIPNLYFKGNSPSLLSGDPFRCPNIGDVNVGIGCRRPVGWMYSSEYCYWKWAMWRNKQPLDSVTCWVEVGASGWDTTKKWYGATVKYAPGKVTIAPDETSAETVTISCINPNASIFYTLDGSDPEPRETSVCHRYTGSFNIVPSKMTTVRAISYVDGCPLTPTDMRIYNAQGIAIAPDVEGSMGEVFWYSGNLVTLTTETTDAYMRYTLDGSDVTAKSPLYTEPFAISETTTVRAKAFKENWIDSDEAVQTFTRLWHTNETPVVSAAAETFETASQEVSLSCETEDATIYYTIDGSEPSAQNGRLYKEPFDIYQTTTVKAIAVKDDWKDSAVASATFTKANAIGPAINLLEVLPDNDKDSPWTVVTDVTHDGVSAAKSGAIEDDESTTLKAVIYGAGELSFWWKASCEPSIEGEYYDYGTFYNGSTIVTNIAGVTEWQHVTLKVPGTAKHTFKWTYQKDGAGSTVPDCIWLDQVQWLPETTDYYADHTLTTEAPVKYKWLRSYGLSIEDDFEAAAKAKTGKIDGAGRVLTVEDDFVAGTDPTNLTSRFTSAITMEGGIPKITWTPDLGEGREYKVWGKESLIGGDWVCPTNSAHRFFKVTVEMP